MSKSNGNPALANDREPARYRPCQLMNAILRSQECNTLKLFKLSLWRIDGDEIGGSCTGPTTILVLTNGPNSIPDPHAAIETVSGGRFKLYRVNSIRQVGSDPDPIEDVQNWHPKIVVNQTSYSMSSEIASLLAYQIIREAWPRDRQDDDADRHQELVDAVQRFVENFEWVFDGDWDHTQTSLMEDPSPYISPGGTFLDPKADDLSGY
jgi:hypothetical protein